MVDITNDYLDFRIDYISGPPGVGKTRWALEQMSWLYQDKRSIGFYVAPTNILLQEVMEEFVTMIQNATQDSETKIRSRLCLMTSQARSGQGTNANHLRVLFRGGRRPGEDAESRGLRKGDIVFMTHEALYSFPRDLVQYKSQIEVIFDEAKKSVFQDSSPYKIPQSVVEIMNKVFTFRLQVRDDPKTGGRALTPYFKVGLTDWYTPELVRDMEIEFTKFVRSRQRRNQISSHTANSSIRSFTDFLESANNPNLHVYVHSKNAIWRDPDEDKDVDSNEGSYYRIPTLNDDPEERGKGDPVLDFYKVKVPGPVFRKYKRVTLLGANFESSQMYYLVSRLYSDVELRCINNEVSFFKTRRRKITKRYESVEIIPLLNQTQSLSKTQMKMCILPSEQVSVLKAYLAEHKIRRDMLEHLLSHIRQGSKLTVAQQKVWDGMESFIGSTNPAEWMLEKGTAIAKKWMKRNKIKHTKKTRPLAFVNTDQEKWVDEEELRQITTFAYGLNKYKSSSVALFLSAINPSPALYMFLQVILGNDYVVEDDYVLDVCIQCICRTNVRDTKAKEPTLVIVPTMTLAKKLKEKLEGLPTINTKYVKKYNQRLFQYRSTETQTRGLTGKERRKEERRQNLRTKKSIAKGVAKYYANPLKKELSSKRAGVYYWTRKIEEAKDSVAQKKAKAKLNALQTRIRELEDLIRIENGAKKAAKRLEHNR